jgi:ABC-type amino acid transport system permease subunit
MQRSVLLSSLWIFVTLNYLYADVFSLMDPVLLPQWVDGHVAGLAITRPLLLAAAVMMEVPIAMTLLARILPYRANRAANIAAGLFKTMAMMASLTVGTPNMHYLFFAAIEIACTVVIMVVAWRWKETGDR